MTHDGWMEWSVDELVNTYTSLDLYLGLYVYESGWKDLFCVLYMRRYKCNFLAQEYKSPESGDTI